MKYVIVVSETGAPIPFRGWDWEAHIDGNEEDGSALAAKKWDAVRRLIDELEQQEEEAE